MRTNVVDVKLILPTDLDDTTIESYIGAANLFVTEHLDGQLDDELLEEIERWITCHLMAVTRERKGTKEEIGQAKIEYTEQFGKLLYMTTYGQTAITLDSTGTLKLLADDDVQNRIVTFWAL
jgi:hypothetical protein